MKFSLFLPSFLQTTRTTSSAGWRRAAGWQSGRNGPRTCTSATRASCVTPTTYCATSTTTARPAPPTAGPATTPSDTTPATTRGTATVRRAGGASTAPTVSVTFAGWLLLKSQAWKTPEWSFKASSRCCDMSLLVQFVSLLHNSELIAAVQYWGAFNLQGLLWGSLCAALCDEFVETCFVVFLLLCSSLWYWCSIMFHYSDPSQCLLQTEVTVSEFS